MRVTVRRIRRQIERSYQERQMVRECSKASPTLRRELVAILSRDA